MKKRKLYKIFIYIILLVLPLIPVILLNGQMPARFENVRIQVLLGLFAYILMLEALFLATRPKLFEGMVGLKDLHFIHGIIALVAMLALAIHAQSLSAEGLVKYSGGLAAIIFLGLGAISMVFFTKVLTSRIRFLNEIKTFIYKYLDFDHLIWLHRANALACLLVFVHISLISEFRSLQAFYILIVIYTVISLSSAILMQFRNLLSPKMASISSVSKIGEDYIELVLKAPKVISKELVPGKFTYISPLKDNPLLAYHPFSIVSNEDGLVKLGISLEGDFTKKLSNLKEGDQVRVTPSYGLIDKLDKEINREIPFIILSGGIGITPFLSLLESNSQRPMYLYYSYKKGKEVPFEEDLLSLKNHENRQIIVQNHRFDLKDILSNHPNFDDCFYLISGPQAMVNSFTKGLVASGVSQDKIYVEEFS